MHRPILAGNWKMHLGPDAARRHAGLLREGMIGRPRVEWVLFPAALALGAVRECLEGTGVAVGVQNVHWASSGAFTGEVSAEMAREAGASWTLVGHSERRTLFGERDEETAFKVRAALRAGLRPMLCVGEVLEERRAGRLREVLERQLDAVTRSLDGPAPGMALAYEPVWAIGTGETATPEDAAEAHGILRTRLGAAWGSVGQDLPILYGGSVRGDNAGALLRTPGVDGVLVGGASLDPAEFLRIADSA